jgi:hypothetical protein
MNGIKTLKDEKCHTSDRGKAFVGIHIYLSILRKKKNLLRHLSYKNPSDLVKIGSGNNFVAQIIYFSELLCKHGKF